MGVRASVTRRRIAGAGLRRVRRNPEAEEKTEGRPTRSGAVIRQGVREIKFKLSRESGGRTALRFPVSNLRKVRGPGSGRTRGARRGGTARCSQGYTKRRLDSPRSWAAASSSRRRPISGGSGSLTPEWSPSGFSSGLQTGRCLLSLHSWRAVCSAGFTSRPTYACWLIRHSRSITT